MRAATRVGCFLLGLTLWVSSIGNSSAQEPSSGEKLFQGLVTPDPINMTTLTIGSAATGPGWIRASANLLIGERIISAFGTSKALGPPPKAGNCAPR